MVVALHAPWGSGKTSALNLVQRHLSVLDIAELTGRPVEELTAQSAARGDDATEEERELARCWSKLCHHHREQCRTTVVRFNPWFFSGQENLFKAFFGVLGTELSIANDTAVATAVAAVLKRGAEAGAALGAAAGLAAAGPPGAIGGATVAGFFGKLLNDQFDKNESLEASLQRLREALQRSDKRLVVIVDDIDRLMPDELRHMLALVKSLGNLPNITYVLAYDFREVVKLLKLADIHSADYLDKIVQVSFDLPSADRYSLREMLFSKLEAIRRRKELEDPRRWQNAYFTYIHRYLKTPRDVTRLCNSLQVIWPSVEGEVDWTDLVVLQTLRLHEPSLHAN
jgi:predicted KAP-like P-loop ATPase